MGKVMGVVAVSADPRLVFRIVQVLHTVASPLESVARTRAELGALLVDGRERIVIAGLLELWWLRAETAARRVHGIQACIAVGAAVTPHVVMEVIALGATAVIADEALETQLPHAVEHALAGMVWLPSTVMPSLARALTSPRSPVAPVPAGATLSGREADVIALFAKGYSNKEIAEHLGIATKTVETYKHRVKLRFNVSERRDLVALAEQEGLLHRHTPPVGQAAIPGRRADGTGRA